MATAAELDPLDFHIKLCQNTFEYPADLALLNELPCYVMIYDLWEKNNAKRLWANAPWLHYVGQTLEQFQAFDFAGNTSHHIKRRQYDLGQDIQGGRARVNFHFTMYPNDEPLRVVLLHQPIIFEGWEHPACFACIYPDKDGDLPPDRPRAPLLNFHFDGPISNKGHDYSKVLGLLDEVPCFTFLLDFHLKQSPRHLWANAAWLANLRKALEDFQSAPFAEIMPACVQLRAEMLRQHVQTQRQTHSYDTIIRTNEKALRAKLVFRPIIFACMDRPMILCTVAPASEAAEEQALSPECGESASSVSAAATLSRAEPQSKGDLYAELAFWALGEVGAFLFDFQPGLDFGTCALWANCCGRTMYSVSFDARSLLTRDGSPLTVQCVLDNCLWGDQAEVAAVIQRLRHLRLGSDAVVFTCRKAAAGRGRGSEAWHQLSFAPCRNPYTGGLCLYLQETNVSDLMRVQAELQASNDFKDKLLQCVSHELRTPLHGILGLSAVLAASSDSTPRMRTALTTIDASAKKLNELVTDMLSTAEIMAGNFSLSLLPVNLAELCERVCDTVRPRLHGGVKLVNRIQGLGVEADAARLQAVFAQLLDNAAKFTTRGEIEVWATVQAAAAGDGGFGWVRVEVRDSGCGIRGEELGSIWEHFQQGDMSATRKYSGTGLGLALVKMLVRAHGGDVAVKSTMRADAEAEEGGSTFSFTLPMPREQPAEFEDSLSALRRQSASGGAGDNERKESCTDTARQRAGGSKSGDDDIGRLQRRLSSSDRLSVASAALEAPGVVSEGSVSLVRSQSSAGLKANVEGDEVGLQKRVRELERLLRERAEDAVESARRKKGLAEKLRAEEETVCGLRVEVESLKVVQEQMAAKQLLHEKEAARMEALIVTLENKLSFLGSHHTPGARVDDKWKKTHPPSTDALSEVLAEAVRQVQAQVAVLSRGVQRPSLTADTKRARDALAAEARALRCSLQHAHAQVAELEQQAGLALTCTLPSSPHTSQGSAAWGHPATMGDSTLACGESRRADEDVMVRAEASLALARRKDAAGSEDSAPEHRQSQLVKAVDKVNAGQGRSGGRGLKELMAAAAVLREGRSPRSPQMTRISLLQGTAKDAERR